jgi:hypothetical protein
MAGDNDARMKAHTFYYPTVTLMTFMMATIRRHHPMDDTQRGTIQRCDIDSRMKPNAFFYSTVTPMISMTATIHSAGMMT